MIVQGSMNYLPSGRKKKKVVRGRKATPDFKPLQTRDVYRRETTQVRSLDSTAHECGTTKKDFQKEVSAKYTVAVAFNKGAYQVISKDNVKDIGR